MTGVTHQLTYGDRAVYVTITAMPLQAAADAGAPAVTTKIDRKLVTAEDLLRIVTESIQQIESGGSDAGEA